MESLNTQYLNALAHEDQLLEEIQAYQKYGDSEGEKDASKAYAKAVQKTAELRKKIQEAQEN